MKKTAKAFQALGVVVAPFLKSRRALIALAAVAVSALTLLVPELEAVHDELVVLIVTLALMLIGGFSIDEAARIARESDGEDEERLRALIKELLSELFEDMVQQEKEEPHV